MPSQRGGGKGKKLFDAGERGAREGGRAEAVDKWQHGNTHHMMKKDAPVCDVMSVPVCRDFSSGNGCKWGARCRFSHDAAPTCNGAATQHPPRLQQGRCELPDGWVKCTSPDGRKFYHCLLTATSHWQLPQDAPAPRSVPLPAASAPSQPEGQGRGRAGGGQHQASLADLTPADVAALVLPPLCPAAARVMKQPGLQCVCFFLTRRCRCLATALSFNLSHICL
jgi:hypothetical protein